MIFKKKELPKPFDEKTTESFVNMSKVGKLRDENGKISKEALKSLGFMAIPFLSDERYQELMKYASIMEELPYWYDFLTSIDNKSLEVSVNDLFISSLTRILDKKEYLIGILDLNVQNGINKIITSEQEPEEKIVQIKKNFSDELKKMSKNLEKMYRFNHKRIDMYIKSIRKDFFKI